MIIMRQKVSISLIVFQWVGRALAISRESLLGKLFGIVDKGAKMAMIERLGEYLKDGCTFCEGDISQAPDPIYQNKC